MPKTRSVWPTLRGKIAGQKVVVSRHFQASWTSEPMRCSLQIMALYKLLTIILCVCLCVLVSGGSDATGYWQRPVTSVGLGCKVWRWIAITNHYGTTGTRADQDTWQVVLTTLSNHWNGSSVVWVWWWSHFVDIVVCLLFKWCWNVEFGFQFTDVYPTS